MQYVEKCANIYNTTKNVLCLCKVDRREDFGLCKKEQFYNARKLPSLSPYLKLNNMFFIRKVVYKIAVLDCSKS